ncbi:superoxide dismutase family protein [Paenibacillus sp. MBLB4367]|uniref:superoxide dismutase family protein n=1 Tax=Paenibacillus sp. MBLB4367 TaxID=3384767 RepID=UPI00390808E8
MNKRNAAAGFLLLCGAMLSGCGAAKETSAQMDSGNGMVHVGIMNTKGESIGSAMLSEKADGVHILIEASKLKPGLHGFHIHETGKCDPPEFTTAGAHLNPEGKQHGFENPKGPHDGDLLNLEVGSDGTVKAELVDKRVTLVKDKPNSLLKAGGTSLIIHEGPDDYKTDPAGNSGARVACGVIK